MTTMPTAADLLPLLPELVLVGGAFVLLMLDLFLDDSRRIVTHLSAIVQAGIIFNPIPLAD